VKEPVAMSMLKNPPNHGKKNTKQPKGKIQDEITSLHALGTKGPTEKSDAHTNTKEARKKKGGKERC